MRADFAPGRRDLAGGELAKVDAGLARPHR
jgi:hypothetical protein